MLSILSEVCLVSYTKESNKAKCLLASKRLIRKIVESGSNIGSRSIPENGASLLSASCDSESN
jgi:hypothetical protein